MKINNDEHLDSIQLRICTISTVNHKAKACGIIMHKHGEKQNTDKAQGITNYKHRGSHSTTTWNEKAKIQGITNHKHRESHGTNMRSLNTQAQSAIMPNGNRSSRLTTGGTLVLNSDQNKAAWWTKITHTHTVTYLASVTTESSVDPAMKLESCRGRSHLSHKLCCCTIRTVTAAD